MQKKIFILIFLNLKDKDHFSFQKITSQIWDHILKKLMELSFEI